MSSFCRSIISASNPKVVTCPFIFIRQWIKWLHKHHWLNCALDPFCLLLKTAITSTTNQCQILEKSELKTFDLLLISFPNHLRSHFLAISLVWLQGTSVESFKACEWMWSICCLENLHWQFNAFPPRTLTEYEVKFNETEFFWLFSDKLNAIFRKMHLFN